MQRAGKNSTSLRRQMEAAYAKARTLAQERERLVLMSRPACGRWICCSSSGMKRAANLTAGEEVELARSGEPAPRGEIERGSCFSLQPALWWRD